MASPCTNDPNEVISAVVGIQSAEEDFERELDDASSAAAENADKFDAFVNGTATQTVQLGEGAATPTIRNTVRQMLSAASELPNADVSGKSSTADGGSEMRTLAERFGDLVNVRDYGAKGDGTTDDSAAFRAAALSQGQASEATDSNPVVCCVFVPKGVYNLESDPLTNAEYGDYGNNNFNVYWIVDRAASFVGDGRLKSPVLRNYPLAKSMNWFHAWQTESGGRTHIGPNSAKLLMLTEPNAPMDTTNILSAVQTKDGTVKRDYTGIFSSVVNNHNSIAHRGWGVYSEAIRATEAANAVYGAEIDPVNCGSYHRVNPYGQSTKQSIGIQIAAGAEYPGLTHSDCSAAIQITGNVNTPENGLSQFGIGINIMASGIQGVYYDSQAEKWTGAGTAIAMARGHRIAWYCGLDLIGSFIENYVDTSEAGSSFVFGEGYDRLYQTKTGKTVFQINRGSSPDRGLLVDLTNEADCVQIAAYSDTLSNADISIRPKGSGLVKIGTATAQGAVSCDRYIRIKDTAGNVLRVPCVME